MSQSNPPLGRDASAAQLKLFKTLSAILAILLLAGAGFYVYKQRQIQPVKIIVDGIGVTTVENAAAANALLERVTKQQTGAAFGTGSSKPLRKETIQIERIPDGQAITLDSDDTAYSKLLPLIHVSVVAYVIEVDKQPFVGLATESAAKDALDAVRKHYEDMPPHDPVVGKSTFREKVTIERKRIPAALVRQTPEDAATVLLTAPPGKVYTVEMHDTGWSIARKFHLNFTTFLEANNDRDINKLHPGDEVKVSKTTPPLTVIVTKESSRTEAIRKGVADEDSGLRRITLQTTYINGAAAAGGAMPTAMETVRRAKPSRSIE